MEYHHYDENWWKGWNVAKMMTLIHWWISIIAYKILMKTSGFDENTFWEWNLGWKFHMVMKIHHFDGNSYLWWKFIIEMKIQHCGENHHCDENSSKDEYSSLWWKIGILMNIHHCGEN